MPHRAEPPPRSDDASDDAPIHNRTQFLALVAGRLAALPAPYPDLALISVALPDLAALHQTYGGPAAEQLLDRIYAAIHRFSPETLIGRAVDGPFAMTYEFDSAWTSVADIASDFRAVIDGSSRGMQLSLVAPALLGAAVQSGRPPLGMALPMASELWRQANLAVQSAARDGRDGFVLYSQHEDERVRRATMLDQSLRRGVAENEFRLHYQPVVDLRSLDMVGLEGLIRWETPSAGLRGPEDFVAAAEASGLIVQIGAAVLDIAVRQMEAWIDLGWAPPRVAINVAPAQLQDPKFRATILDAVSRGRVKPANLEIEMTERSLVTWERATWRLLDELREMGITLALDDFGTGFSSLRHLRDMPLSKLKIDRTFIRRIATDRRDAALVKTIVGLGEALGIDIVAEGIELKEQADMLLECGCTIGQGYLFSRPRPAAEVPDMQAALRHRHRDATARAARQSARLMDQG